MQAAKDTKHRMGKAADQLTIIHFNDVYNIDSREESDEEKEKAAKAVEEGHEPELQPVGGAARFVTAVNAYDELSPMILFSGDIFAPSIRTNFSFLVYVVRRIIRFICSQHVHQRRTNGARSQQARRSRRLFRQPRL